jgi:hypothetical protein
MIKLTYPRLMRLLFWGALSLLSIAAVLPGSYLPPITNEIWDKAQHALAYAALTLIGFSVFANRKPALVGGLFFHGAAIELVQALLVWRYGDWLDWVADAVGIVTGYVMAAIFHRYNTHSRLTKD